MHGPTWRKMPYDALYNKHQLSIMGKRRILFQEINYSIMFYLSYTRFSQ